MPHVFCDDEVEDGDETGKTRREKKDKKWASDNFPSAGKSKSRLVLILQQMSGGGGDIQLMMKMLNN